MDCVNERVEREFTGNCKMCGKPGHRQSQCSENRFLANFASVEIDELAAGDAWKALEVADTAKDVDDIKTVFLSEMDDFTLLTYLARPSSPMPRPIRRSPLRSLKASSARLA